MAPLSDPDRLAAYRDALANWNCTGFVCFELNETAHKWLRSQLDGVTTKEFARLMHEHIESGGEIDEVRESREGWSDEFEFHHDLRFSVQGKQVYVETRLYFSPPFAPDRATISVVNIHAS